MSHLNPHISPREQAILPEAVDNLVGSLSEIRDTISPDAIISDRDPLPKTDTVTFSQNIVEWHGLDPNNPEIQAVIDGVWALVFSPETTVKALETFQNCTEEGYSFSKAVVRTAAIYDPYILVGDIDPGEDRIVEITDLPLSIAHGLGIMTRYINVRELY